MDLTQSFYGSVAVSKPQKRSHSHEASRGGWGSTAHVTMSKNPRRGESENPELENLGGDDVPDAETQDFPYDAAELSADPALEDLVDTEWCHKVHVLTSLGRNVWSERWSGLPS